MSPTVFLGLVTHRGSRFPEARGADGPLARIGAALALRGVGVITSVHVDDLHDNEVVPLTRDQVRASIRAELDLERRWREYVDPRSSGLALRAQMSLRRAYRDVRLAPPWRGGDAASEAGAAMLRRLVNIEFAHLNLMREAVGLGADWALIVEDDASLDDATEFADSLVAFMQATGTRSQPQYVNASRSFAHATLGMRDHLTRVGDWSPGISQWAADRPLTNTVCAVLYRGTFLQRLLPALEDIPVSPVLPIDWKLNAALLDLQTAGDIGPGDCWFLDPAPIVQGSMHGSGSHPVPPGRDA